MSVIKRNMQRRSRKKNMPEIIVVIKTQHFGNDMMFDKKLAEANAVLSRTRFMDGSVPVRKN